MELLVAVAIGLLGTIVIFTVYRGADGYKRTIVAGGDAQSNAAVATLTLERYIRTAGSGIATTNEVSPVGSLAPAPLANLLLGCPLSGLPAGGVVTRPNGAAYTPVAPVRIVDGSLTPGGNASSSDVLVIMAGNADLATNPTQGGIIPPGSTTASVTNAYGWRLADAPRLGDVALMVTRDRPLVAPLFDAVSPVGPIDIPCSARRVIEFAPAVPVGGLATGSRTFTFSVATPASPRGYTPGSNIHNIGPTPYFLSISVNAQQELVESNFARVLTGESATPDVRIIADGILSLQAQYGIDRDQDDVIDAWVEPTGIWANPVRVDVPTTVATGVVRPLIPDNPPAITRIKAIRFAVLARSVHYEPPNRNLSPVACDATPTRTTWPLLPAIAGITGANAGASALAQPASANILPAVIASTPSNSADANWQCFRYRTFESVVPVINMIRSPL